jgi:hypothetical protein
MRIGKEQGKSANFLRRENCLQNFAQQRKLEFTRTFWNFKSDILSLVLCYFNLSSLLKKSP